MKIGWNSRNLTTAEQRLASDVFGTSLPQWELIMISDGLGIGDAPWTDNPMVLYAINIGPIGYPDCTSFKSMGGFGAVRDVFIHEMTHVWQYYHGYSVKSSSVAARVWEKVSGDDAYDYTLGKSWASYNVEEQASIVEHWFSGGERSTDDRFVYVDKIIRKGVPAWFNPRNLLPLADLRTL